ncbi:MAG: hypothetical protein BroJett018_40060 [Chloroflexota bacterium]|nr:MAG: hypothetical protein BroJett018_40060 [Chloroflexota bacterium]
MNIPIKHEIQVVIEYYTGQDDDGQPYFVAHSDDLHFTTQGETFEALLAHVRECLQLSLEDTDSIAEYGVARDAKLHIVKCAGIKAFNR